MDINSKHALQKYAKTWQLPGIINILLFQLFNRQAKSLSMIIEDSVIQPCTPVDPK